MKWEFVICHWVLTLLCGPIFFSIVKPLNDSNGVSFFSLLEIYPMMLLMGLIFSLPTYIFYSFVFDLIKNKSIKIIYGKIILIIIVVTGIFITTALIDGTWWFDIAISYSIACIITWLFLNLKFEDNTN
jgi:hypothetical protein